MPYINVDVDIDVSDLMDEVSDAYLLKEVQKRGLIGVNTPLDTSEVWDTLLLASDIARTQNMQGLSDRLDHLRRQHAVK